MNGKEDMRGQRHLGEDTFGILGKEALFEIRDCIFWWVFFWFGVWVDCTGEHRLLGVLGSGARNPHEILELGSWIGFAPRWQGGKI